MLIPAVAASGCLFCGVRGFCVKCKGTFTAFSLMLFLVWHLSIIIDGCASSDRSLGPMLVWVCCGFVVSRVWVLSRSLSWGGVVWVHYIACECGARCMCHVEVISGVFSFCYVMMGRKNVIMFILSQHNRPPQTCLIPRDSRKYVCLHDDKDLVKMSARLSRVGM